MEFIAIIPARYASTRFPGKPLVKIGDKMMIQLVYQRVAQHFEHCYVATDDRRIEQAVIDFGGRVVMTSTDHRSGTDRCAEALEKIEHQTGKSFDVVVNIQGDEPFVSIEQLTIIRSAFDNSQTQIATLVKQFGPDEDIFNPNSPKVVVSESGFALYFSRSVVPYLRGVEPEKWQAQHVFWKHIGLYAYRSDVLRAITKLPQGENEKAESLEQLRWLENGYKIKVSQTETQSLAIDTPEDLERVLKNLETV